MATLFERIIAREIPAKVEFEDDRCIAIRDISPAGPTHVLVIPKRVIPRLEEVTEADEPLLGHLLACAAHVARTLKLAKGFRIVINNGPDANETVPHLHVHVIGGRAMSWPPG